MTERIVYVSSHFPYGTGESFLASEVRALGAVVDDLVVVAVRARSDLPMRATGATCHRLPPMLGRESLRSAARMLKLYPLRTLKLFYELCFSRYRAVAKLKNVAVFFKGLALADYLADQPVTMVHAHWLTTPSTVALIAARLLGLPVSFSAHRFDVYSDNWLEAKFAACNFVRVISERGARDLRARIPARFHNRIHVIHMGVELPNGVVSPPLSRTVLRLTAVGSLVHVKGHRYLVEALARLRDAGVPFSCDIFGQGPLRRRLAGLITSHGLDSSVRLKGFVPHDQLINSFTNGNYDVFIHPSTESGTLHEGIPVALMEAMARRIPCVATRTGSIPELLDNSCGVVVEQRNSDALARAVVSLVDEAARHRLADAAQLRIASGFEASSCARHLLDLMRKAKHAQDLA